MKKMTLVEIYHTLIWFSYSVILFLSHRDKLRSKIFLFFVFFYVAYIVGDYVLRERWKAIRVTVRNVVVFLTIYMLLSLI
ncbi:hypothetical protein [Ectobacillus polymachus]|uniref:hypothetical protein n=1 Tax=Ectobacillus polymachus TaxID=1508806 RepID=UPI003A84887F